MTTVSRQVNASRKGQFGSVNVRNTQISKELYLNQTEDNCWEAKSQQIEKMLQKMAVLPLVLYIRIKGEDVRGSHESKQGNLWD